MRILSTNTLYAEEPFSKLLLRAGKSDGADLVFADVHSRSMRALEESREISFDPVLQTRYGFAWREGSSLQGHTLLHRSDMSLLPVALETDRETMHIIDCLFSESPLRNVVMGTSSQLMLFQYLQMAQSDAFAFCDSLRFYIMKKLRADEVEGLHFTPLSTLSSFVQIGFLIPRKSPLSAYAQFIVRILRHYLAKHCADYYE